jgi:hypothetical protein
MTVIYTPIGYGVTDENGQCTLDHDVDGNPLTHSYTGTGAGEVDIVASLDSEITESSLVSETFVLMDCIKMDNGTKNDYTDIWNVNTTNSTITISRENEYTEFKETTTGNNLSNYTIGLNESCVIELDYWQLDGLSNTFMQLQDATTQVYSGGINLGSLNGSLETWYHLKITIKDGVATILNTTNGASIVKNLTNTPTRFVFWSSGDVSTLRFKNFMIYPI